MRIVRGFWVILLMLSGCGHAPLARLVARSSAENELYAMAVRAVLDEPRIPERYIPMEGGTVYCLGLHGRPPHPAFLARFATHPAHVGPQSACARKPSDLPPGEKAPLSLRVRFDAVDWSEPEQPLVRGSIVAGSDGTFVFDSFGLEMSFERDGERWRVRHRSLEYTSCTGTEQLW